ncbi:MAG: CoA pyrophosphatase [Anaeromyxobacter sp.]
MTPLTTPGFEEAVSALRRALAARAPDPLEVPAFRRAAVLVPLLARPDGPTVLFTRRSQELPHHRGEISFPGGGLDPGESPEEGALREAQEEVGLSPSASEVLGRLDDLPSIARYVVTPVVAAIRAPPEAFTPAAGEVAEGFEVPLSRLLDPAIRRAALWDPSRLPPEVPVALIRARIPFEETDGSGKWKVWSFAADPERVIWGLTARIVATLLDRAFGAARPLQ